MSKVLIVSQSEETFKTLKEILPGSRFAPIRHASSIWEAKKKLRSESYDLCLIQTPLKDEFGVRSAKEIVFGYPVGVLLLVKNDIYDQVSYQVQDDGIFVLGLPSNRRMIYQSVNMLDVSRQRLHKMEIELTRMKKKSRDDKVIQQAKLVLIANYHWDEDKAHHYLEKIAMDTGQAKITIARSIINQEKNNEKTN